MQWTSLDVVNEAVTQLLVGFGLALLNVVICYFAPRAPRVVSVLRWPNLKRALILAYLVALALQLATSPFFVAAWQRVSVELAWSPYQAIFNVLGVVLVDLIVRAWGGLRKGAEVGRQQISEARVRAADVIGDMNMPAVMSDEERAARRQAQEEAAVERKQRMDEKLKNY